MKFGADIGCFEKSHVNIASGGDTSKLFTNIHTLLDILKKDLNHTLNAMFIFNVAFPESECLTDRTKSDSSCLIKETQCNIKAKQLL
jgi:hypothetical protein